MSSALWARWYEIAVEQVGAAEDAQNAAIDTRQSGGDPADAIGRELKASMQAVSAAAHCLDGFYGLMGSVIDVPPGLRETWRKNRTPRSRQILETLKLGFSLGSEGTEFGERLDVLFNLRDAAVHHKQRLAPARRHPADVDVSEEATIYSAESAHAALTLADRVLESCLAHPKPATAPLAAQMTPGFSRLQDLRSARTDGQ